MKGVQCYELFGGIALKNHTFSFFINIWYLDDATFGGPAESVCEDLRRIIPMLSDIGLEVNPTKSEVSNVSCHNFQSVLLAIESALPRVTVTEREDLSILKAPIDINGCRTEVFKAVERLSTMSRRLESIDAHPAFFLLRNCLSMPRLIFKLRSSPCYRLHAELTEFDKTLRLPRSATSILTIPGGNSRLFPSLKVVLVSSRQ